MVNLDIINGAIAELEAQEMTHVLAQKLAALYIIRNNNVFGGVESKVDQVAVAGDSEFLQAVNGKQAKDVWSVMNELMTMLYVTNKPLYESVMRKLQD